MKLLLDECVDWRLLRDLPDFEVKTVGQMGWTGIDNGASLKVAEREFDAFITVDKNLSFQQNLAGFAISVVVLRARSLRLADLRKLVPKLKAALHDPKKGKVQIIN
jgi:predicted nuclease of predicted toxin-antitoxin system